MKSQRVQKTRTTWQARGIAAVARFGMLVAILGALALRVPVAQVSAGGESLTASENPVIIPFGKSSQSFTLSWNSGNGQPIEFTGSLNGGPESGTFPGPAVGTAAESINLGEQFTWRMYTPGKKQLLAALTVTTKSALQAVAPCAQQCIKSVQVDPHGTFANFEIVTVPAVKVTLAASVVGQPGVASATFNLGMDKDWHTFLMDLKPNTKYTYDVKATDSDGNVQHKTGTFTTLHRQVTITFTSLHVISEDDEDMHFFFNTNNFWDTGNCFPNGPTFDSCPMGKVNAGDTVNPGYVKVAFDVPETLTLMVQGVEDTCSGIIWLPIPYTYLCTNGLGLDPGNVNAKDGDTIRATAVGQIVMASGNKLDEVYTDTFTITSPAANYRFSASGTIKVDYVK